MSTMDEASAAKRVIARMGAEAFLAMLDAGDRFLLRGAAAAFVESHTGILFGCPVSGCRNRSTLPSPAFRATTATLALWVK